MWEKSFISFFPICIPFISLSCLIVQTYIPIKMFKRHSEMEHFCLVCDLVGKVSSSSPLSMMLAVSILSIFLINLRKIPPIPSVLTDFILSVCQILPNAFSMSIDMIIDFSSLSFVMVDFIDWLLKTEQALGSWNKSHLVVIYNSF